jgi:selenocysteine lyase/cysteine desulfurase
MGIDNILNREHELLKIVFKNLESVKNLNILAPDEKKRLGVFSFYINDLHFNLGVKLLNDKFGIQTRGGCSCAGTYGHYLLHVDQEMSNDLVCQISSGDLIRKPGWMRMSIHPTTTNQEIEFVCNSIKELAKNFKEWQNDYQYNNQTNEFEHINQSDSTKQMVADWFINS